MAAERFFTKVANDVLDATERLSNAIDDGVSVLLTGSLPEEQQREAPDIMLEGDDEAEEMFAHSPLKGMAESVLGDIMQSQVRGC